MIETEIRFYDLWEEKKKKEKKPQQTNKENHQLFGLPENRFQLVPRIFT